MNVTDELLFPKAVGVGVSFFFFLLSIVLLVAIPIRRGLIEFSTGKKVRKRRLVIPVFVTICILSVVSFFLFSKQIDRSYDGILMNRILKLSIFMSLVCTLLIVLVVLIIRWTVKDKWEVWRTTLCLLLCLGVLGFAIYSLIDAVSPMVKDFREQSYVEYYGEFENEQIPGFRGSTIKLLDGSGITVYTPSPIKEGVFKGTVVYTERSHLRLEIRYDE